jgi:hypothetical protein
MPAPLLQLFHVHKSYGVVRFVDPQARHLMCERLQNLLQQGKAILPTTHLMDESRALVRSKVRPRMQRTSSGSRPAARRRSSMRGMPGRCSTLWRRITACATCTARPTLKTCY